MTGSVNGEACNWLQRVRLLTGMCLSGARRLLRTERMNLDGILKTTSNDMEALFCLLKGPMFLLSSLVCDACMTTSKFD
jgi:hypothetical protein